MLYTGVDLIELQRIEQAVARWGERFLRRIWTAEERAICAGRLHSLAGRWAAKEATAKALGLGLRGLGAPSNGVAWHEIEILRDSQGRPMLSVHGAAQQHTHSLGIYTWSLSISHTTTMAVAFVVGMGASGATSYE